MIQTARSAQNGAALDMDFELVRCICGAVLAEFIIPAGGDTIHRSGWRKSARRPLARRGSVMRVKCDFCRDTILRRHPDYQGMAPGRLLVMQEVDLAEAEIIPDRVGIFLDYVRGDRSLTRGGEGLPRRVLDEALALARSGDTVDGC